MFLRRRNMLLLVIVVQLLTLTSLCFPSPSGDGSTIRDRIKDKAKDIISDGISSELDVKIDAAKDKIEFQPANKDDGDPECTGDSEDMSPAHQKLVDRLIQACQKRRCAEQYIQRIRNSLRNKRSRLRLILGRSGQDPTDDNFEEGEVDMKPVSGPLVRFLIKILGETRTVIGYLWRYGFLPKVLNKSPRASENFNGTIPPCAVTNAVRAFQTWNKLEATGVLTKETRELMAKDRCGNADVECETEECKVEMDDHHQNHLRRRKRYGHSRNAWPANADGKIVLTYAFLNYPDVEKMKKKKFDVMTKERIRKQVEEGFKVWSDVAPIVLRETGNEDAADIKVSFGEYDHGDGTPFTGAGGSLAHMFYPIKGIMHFDASENFTDAHVDFRSVNLFYTAAHEMGHGLGLKHSTDYGALMYPYYTGYRDPMLGVDDINGITARYGEGRGMVHPLVDGEEEKEEEEEEEEKEEEEEEEKMEEVTCLHAYTAAAAHPQRTHFYLFAGSKYVRVERLDPGHKQNKKVPQISEGYPQDISSLFTGVPHPIDYAVTVTTEQQTYFFVKDRVYTWSWSDMALVDNAGVNRSDTKFKLLPSDVTSIVEYERGTKSYYFVFYGKTNNQYRVFDLKNGKPYGGTAKPSPFSTQKPNYVVRAAVNSFFPGYFYAFPDKHLSALLSMPRLLKFSARESTPQEIATSIMKSYYLKDILEAWGVDDKKKYEMC